MQKKITIISEVVITVVILSSIYVYNISEKNNLATIRDVVISPGNPNEGDMITITAHLDDEFVLKAPQFSYDVLFYNNEDEAIPLGGSHPMSKESGDTFVTEIGPYNEGAQIWYRIFLPSSTGIGYNEGTIDVGVVDYNTNISIFDVKYSPTNLVNCSTIELTANFSHEDVITSQTTMYGLYYVIYPDGSEIGGGDSLVGIYNITTQNTEYIFLIKNEHDLTPTESTISPYPSDTIIFSRLYFVGEGYKFATPSYTIQIP